MAADLPPDVFKAIEEGMAAGRARVSREADNLGKRVNGWNLSPLNGGEFEQDYLTRGNTSTSTPPWRRSIPPPT
jgi:hypothetical protein